MTEVLNRVSTVHVPRSQWVSSSSSEVWASALRPFVYINPPWLENALIRARELFHAGRVNNAAIVAFVTALDDSLWSDAPVPFVSSTDEGGISAEFETGSLQLDIEATSSGSLLVYVAAGQFDWEGPADELPDGLEKWAWRLGMAHRLQA